MHELVHPAMHTLGASIGFLYWLKTAKVVDAIVLSNPKTFEALVIAKPKVLIIF